MLKSDGFDLWADGYDRAVGLSDGESSYPFAGYREVLGEIYRILREMQAMRVLDVGCGTGVLGARLCAAGLDVTGLDFSGKMLEIARERMPEARLIRWDFANGLPDEVKDGRMDAVVCTYAIHHLPDAEKERLFHQMAACLRPGGRILIGDIAFETAQARAACRQAAGDEWDDDELYMAMDEMRSRMIGTVFSYRQISVCAGLLEMIP